MTQFRAVTRQRGTVRAQPRECDVGGVQRELEVGGQPGGDVVEQIGRKVEDRPAPRALGVRMVAVHSGRW
jgi:hypothetical protein